MIELFEKYLSGQINKGLLALKLSKIELDNVGVEETLFFSVGKEKTTIIDLHTDLETYRGGRKAIEFLESAVKNKKQFTISSK